MDKKYFYDYLVKMSSIAKIGLVFSKDPYAIENYQQVQEATTKMLEEFTEIDFSRPNYFARDIYPTPNLSVRTIIFNENNEVLLVKEAVEGRYSLPGGWIDLYDSPASAAKRECLEEAGAEVDIVALGGILNRTPYKKPESVPEFVIFFKGVIKAPLHKNHQFETDDVNFF